MNPCQGSALIVSSYTHPEYAVSMAQTFKLTEASAFLLRGTEGEPVADARRTHQMDFFHGGGTQTAQAAQAGALQSIPELPQPNAAETAAYIENASLPQQRQALTRLDRLTFTLNETGLKSPSILVVGNVVQACAQIFQKKPSSPTLPLHANM